MTDVRVTQIIVEAVTDAPGARVTQIIVEAVTDAPGARVTQIIVEAMQLDSAVAASVESWDMIPI